MLGSQSTEGLLLGATPEHPAKLVGFGHPLLDISCHVDAAFLSAYAVEPGSCNLSSESQLPIFADLSQRPHVEFVPGGACMNAIRVVRWIVQRDVSTFVGCLGDDEFGRILKNALTQAGVQSIFQIAPSKPTGTCACLIVERERSLLANLGAAVELQMAHMESDAVQRAIHCAEAFYLEGFFMNVVSSPASSVLIGEHAAAHNKLFCFNLSAPYLCEFFTEKLLKILPFVDILFGSAIDFAALATVMAWDAKNKTATLLDARRLPKVNSKRSRVVVMTNGGEATLVAVDDHTVEEFQPLRIPTDQIVDTNGAGDAFVGGFLSQIITGRSVKAAVRCGHVAASIIIQHNGCTMPKEHPLALREALQAATL